MEEITRELESMEPCGAMLDLLLSADLGALTPDQQVTAFILARKIKACADHMQLEILHDFEDTAEMAMATHEPEQSLARQKVRSEVLDRLPRLSEQLRRGEIDLRRLEVVDERVVNLASQELVTQVEDALVDEAPVLTRTQLARRATKAVAEADPLGYDQRRQKAWQRDRRGGWPPPPRRIGEIGDRAG